MRRTSALICACAAAAALTTAGGSAAADGTGRAARAQSSGLDREYLKTGMEGDLFEIQGGKLAEARSGNAAVRKLARTLLRDHTKSFHEAAALARKLGVEVPKDPTPSEQWE